VCQDSVSLASALSMCLSVCLSFPLAVVLAESLVTLVTRALGCLPAAGSGGPSWRDPGDPCTWPAWRWCLQGAPSALFWGSSGVW
jgi:hypothetical protein